MADPVSLRPAARRLAELIANIPDDALAAPTPCTESTVGDLVDHVDGLALAFRNAADRTDPDASAGGPSADASRLGDDWRTRVPHAVLELAEAWDDPAAWTGMTAAGGVEMPGEIAGLVALDEVVIHGWDLAVATGSPYECDAESLAGAHAFVSQFSGPGQEDSRQGLFGPEIAVPADAPPFARLLGMTGRDPGWSPPR